MQTTVGKSASTSNYDVVVPIEDMELELVKNSISNGATEKTIAWYKGMFVLFNEYCKRNNVEFLHQLDNKFLSEYKIDLQSHTVTTRKSKLLAEASIQGHVRAVRAMVRLAQDRGYMAQNIHIKVPKSHKKENRVLTKEEVKTLVREGKTLQHRVAVALAVDSGMRISELADLRWKHVNIQTNLIRVEHGKGNKFRVVTASPKTIMMLMQLKRSQKGHGDDDGVFQSHTGAPMTRWGMRFIFEELVEQTGIQFSAHALRRTCAKFCAQNDMSIVAIQNLLGHENVETTRHYIQDLDPSYILKAHKNHGPMNDLW